MNEIKEWECKCNACGHIWHYLDSVEKQMTRQVKNNSLIGLGMCCNPCVALGTSNANTALNKQLADLRACPKCGSSDVTRKARYFKKE